MNANQVNILLADDDSDDCYFFEKALTALTLSTQLTIVNDGEQLMKHLADEKNTLPDVLFLDLNMPRKNGVECVGEIKSNEKLKHIPVIIFSTSKNKEVMETLFKSGVHVYVRKPSDFGQLKEVIHSALPLAAEKSFTTSSVKYIINA